MNSKSGKQGSISGYFVFLVIWLSANTIFILLKEVYDDSLSPATKESHINLSQVAKKEKWKSSSILLK